MRGGLPTRTRRLRGAAGVVLVMGLMALTLVNCAPVFSDREATRTAEALIVGERLQQTMEADQSTQMVASATARMAQAFTEVAAQRTEAAATQAQATMVAAASATAAMEEQIRANATATQQAAAIAALAQDYQKKNWLPPGDGVFHWVDDYTGDEPNLGNVLVRGTGYDPKVFVIRAQVEYDNADRAGDWARSSCGFVVWRVDSANYYQVYLGMDGYVYANAVVNNRFHSLGKSYYGLPQLPAGSYEITLVVNQTRIYVLQNGKLIKNFLTIDGSQKEGKLYFAVTSGVQKDFGTRCTFRDTELWEVTPAD